jgi:hypothetical protein
VSKGNFRVVSDIPASGAQGDVLIIDRVPTSAIQALYHAATGKTETLEKRLTKNFIVRKSDVEQLYFKIMQQLEHFERIAGPTITVKVSFNNHEHQQFSSWERFKLFDSSRAEVVSDIVIKFEFLIRFPEQHDPQRYVLNIDVDSKLPMVLEDDEPPGFFGMFFGLEKIPSLNISIDFIDYLCAKNFLQIVEAGSTPLKNLLPRNGISGFPIYHWVGVFYSANSQTSEQRPLSRRTCI